MNMPDPIQRCSRWPKTGWEVCHQQQTRDSNVVQKPLCERALLLLSMFSRLRNKSLSYWFARSLCPVAQTLL